MKPLELLSKMIIVLNFKFGRISVVSGRNITLILFLIHAKSSRGRRKKRSDILRSTVKDCLKITSPY